MKSSKFWKYWTIK